MNVLHLTDIVNYISSYNMNTLLEYFTIIMQSK